MKRLLVIGASGLLGTKAIELGKERFQTFGTYHTHHIKGDNFFQLDVNKRQDVFKLLEKVKPNFVLDTHAMHNVDYCETHPEEAWSINVDGTRNVAEASKRIGAKFAFISTDYVFDGKKLEYTEKDKPIPMNYYAKTKLATEYMLKALDINYIVARTALLYGKDGAGKTPFVLWLVDKLRKRENVNIVTDQHNNPTLVDNLTEILFNLFDRDAKGLFHITGKECISRYDFSKTIAKVFNLNSKNINPITSPQLNQIAKRSEKINMNTNKVERVTGLKTLKVEDGLKMLKTQLGE